MNRPYLVAPLLITQSTWGGEYIASLKRLTQVSQPIGQSYELFSGSLLSSKLSSKHQPSYQLTPSAKLESITTVATNDHLISLSDFAATNPQVLGKQKSPILIKLTQALGNSYQLHLKPTDHSAHWQPKPESWYYLAPGLATLGLNPHTTVTAYHQACLEAEDLVKSTAVKLQQKQLSFDQARENIQIKLSQINLAKYVNQISLPRFACVDLAAGGIHHSWEENPTTHPQGNIVYELQREVLDDFCTLRSFDRGKIQPDGSHRPLHINDYFRYLDSTPQINQPHSLIKSKTLLKKTSTYTVNQLFNNQEYQLRELIFTNTFNNYFTHTNHSYHHLFVFKGNIAISAGNHHLHLTPGFSAFVPATISSYSLKLSGPKPGHILQSFV